VSSSLSLPHPSIHPSIHPFIHQSIHPSIHPSTHLPICAATTDPDDDPFTADITYTIATLPAVGQLSQISGGLISAANTM